jgi:hypothetical protein
VDFSAVTRGLGIGCDGWKKLERMNGRDGLLEGEREGRLLTLGTTDRCH